MDAPSPPRSLSRGDPRHGSHNVGRRRRRTGSRLRHRKMKPRQVSPRHGPMGTVSQSNTVVHPGVGLHRHRPAIDDQRIKLLTGRPGQRPATRASPWRAGTLADRLALKPAMNGGIHAARLVFADQSIEVRVDETGGHAAFRELRIARLGGRGRRYYWRDRAQGCWPAPHPAFRAPPCAYRHGR